jgi:Recombination endonuclease VII.
MKQPTRKDPGYNSAQKLRKKYGMTEDDYNKLLAKQKGRCAICGKYKKLVVDHCHTTNKVRGLLCNNCNSMLGFSEDDPTVLSAGMKYLAASTK